MKNEKSNRNYAAHINTFLFRRTWIELINLLPDDDAGKLFKAICVHVRGENAQEYLADRDGLHLLQAVSEIIYEIERGAKHYLSMHGELPEEEPGERENNEQND
ncbi:MAG: hypothetical protein IKB61_01865 [Elusimicrobiaceae bacterium]|nr:hypothetical protein [Elusimicrobiaceae bacterium]